MSRDKMMKIDRKRVNLRLEELHMSRAQLADIMGMHYQSLSRCLRTGSISSTYIDFMGKALDVAPEWLSGDIPDDFPHQYAIHLYQKNKITPQQMVASMLITLGYQPEEVDKKTFWKVYDAMRDAAGAYMKGNS